MTVFAQTQKHVVQNYDDTFFTLLALCCLVSQYRGKYCQFWKKRLFDHEKWIKMQKGIHILICTNISNTYLLPVGRPLLCTSHNFRVKIFLKEVTTNAELQLALFHNWLLLGGLCLGPSAKRRFDVICLPLHNVPLWKHLIGIDCAVCVLVQPLIGFGNHTCIKRGKRVKASQ